MCRKIGHHGDKTGVRPSHTAVEQALALLRQHQNGGTMGRLYAYSNTPRARLLQPSLFTFHHAPAHHSSAFARCRRPLAHHRRAETRGAITCRDMTCLHLPKLGTAFSRFTPAFSTLVCLVVSPFSFISPHLFIFENSLPPL